RRGRSPPPPIGRRAKGRARRGQWQPRRFAAPANRPHWRVSHKGLRARGDDDIVWVGYDNDAKTRALYHLIDERDGIDGMLVAGDVLVPTRFGQSAAHGEEGRCKHDASEVGAPRQERRGGMTAFARPSEMEAGVSNTGFDLLPRRGATTPLPLG